MNKNLDYHLKLADKILVLSKPLIDNFGINYFHFVRIYPDGARISLSNFRKWMEHYYHSKYYINPTFSKQSHNLKDTIHLWLTLHNDKVLFNLKEKFDISNGITFIKTLDDIKEYYYFGTSKDNYDIYNLYMNHNEIFMDYIIFFKNEAKRIIKKCEEYKISNLYEQNITSLEQKYSVNIESFSKTINDYKHSLILSNNIQLGHRELQCIAWCIKGKTADEIATILKIKKRTVESYITSAKIKFNCYKLPELIYKISQCGIKFDKYL